MADILHPMPIPPIPLSHRAQSLKPSGTLAIAAKARSLAKSGADVLNFSLGEPDFDTPELIRKAAADALASGQTHYLPTLGDAETRAVRDYFRIEDQAGRRFWIFRQGDGEDVTTGSHNWFLHGVFG